MTSASLDDSLAKGVIRIPRGVKDSSVITTLGFDVLDTFSRGDKAVRRSEVAGLHRLTLLWKMVLDSVGSPHSRRNYAKALDDLFRFCASRPLSR